MVIKDRNTKRIRTSTKFLPKNKSYAIEKAKFRVPLNNSKRGLRGRINHAMVFGK